MIFGTREEADEFIINNGGLVVEELGTAPVRSVFCPGCGGWHVEGESYRDREEENGTAENLEEPLPESVFSLKDSMRVYYRALEKRVPIAIGNACELMSAGEVNKAERMLIHLQDEIRHWNGYYSERKMCELKESIEAGLGQVARYREMFGRLTLEIEKAKVMMTSCRIDEAKVLLIGVLCELGHLGNGNDAVSRVSKLEGRAKTCLSLIARFEETVGDPKAEKEVMDSEAETKMDVLFHQMVTNVVVVQEAERLFSEVEHLIKQERGREAEEKTEEIKALIKKLDGAGTSRLRALLKDRLFPLEMDLDGLLGEEKGTEWEQKRFLIKAIDRATLADGAKKDGNELLCRNFVTEARLLLARVAACEERDIVESFLSGLGA
jgi:hypothetical protein